MEAHEHPAYHDALGHAVAAARRGKKGSIITVYFDGECMYVRKRCEPRPDNGQVICVVQCYGEAVRMRFAE